MSRRKKKQTGPASTGDEVSLRIDAPADRLYDIVSDVRNMGRLSPECKGGRWVGKAKGPAVDARFRGRNRRGPVVWWTGNKVVAANRGREFAFETRQSGYRWSYRFEPDGDGTIVTESREQWSRRRPLLAKAFTLAMLGGIADHDEEMRAGMRSTLQRLKVVAEADSGAKRKRRRRA